MTGLDGVFVGMGIVLGIYIIPAAIALLVIIGVFGYYAIEEFINKRRKK